MLKNKYVGLTIFIAGSMLTSHASAQDISSQVNNVQIRVQRPLISMGPTGEELDSPFNVIALQTGGFRDFTSNGTTYRLEGTDPWSDGGPLTAVLTPAPGTFAACGLWLNDEQNISGTSYYGYAHAENDCNYSIGQTNKSMALVYSNDEGKTWSLEGQIISGSDTPLAGTATGEGDCTAVRDNVYVYLYCLREKDSALIVARAPYGNQQPGQWEKYYNGSWSQPGIGGLSSQLQYQAIPQSMGIGFGSASVSSWSDTGYTVLINNDAPTNSRGGVTLAFSDDHVNFFKLNQPLLVTDGNQWSRNSASSDLVAYPSAISNKGGRNWSGNFLLAYTYLLPGADFSQRYLVTREVYVSLSQQPASGNSPQVGIELSRWLNNSSNPEEIWTTTAPVPGNYSQFSYEGSLGYVMSSSLTGANAPATVALEECISNWPGNPDHLIDWDGGCIPGGYQRLRTIGWVYTTQQANTQPLYRCWSPAIYKSHFISNDPNCEGKGNMEFLLGYALSS